MRKINSLLTLKIIVVFLLLILGACKATELEINQEIGKWEANIVRPTGYDTVDRRIVLEVDTDNQCFERTTDPNTGVIYGEGDCIIEVRQDGNTWIVYDDGKVLRVGFDDEQLVIYGMFPSFGAEPDVKFSRIE